MEQELKNIFNKYKHLLLFEEGDPMYALDEEDFIAASKEFGLHILNQIPVIFNANNVEALHKIEELKNKLK